MNKNKDGLESSENTRDIQKKKIEKEKEQESQNKIQKQSRTKGSIMKQKDEGTKDSKGTLIAVTNSIKTMSAEVSRYDEEGQTLWIPLNNQKEKIRIGVIYGPQGNMTSNNELKLICKTINIKYQQISTGTYGRQFQCKDKKPYSRRKKKKYQKEEDSSKE